MHTQNGHIPEKSILTEELILSYKKAMALFLDPTSKGSAENIMIFLESIHDPTTDLRPLFAEMETEIHSPSHWIAILRFMRISISIMEDIKKEYDGFVDFYTNLSSRGSPTENEENLKTEIGNFLYKADDLMGRQDRLLGHLIQEIKNILMDTFGVWDNPAEQFFRTEITLDAMIRIEDDLKSLAGLCNELILELRIMHGLLKLKKLME